MYRHHSIVVVFAIALTKHTQYNTTSSYQTLEGH
jgi:hypothetical protein